MDLNTIMTLRTTMKSRECRGKAENWKVRRWGVLYEICNSKARVQGNNAHEREGWSDTDTGKMRCAGLC